MSPVVKPLIAIACGGTGGHLFPGIAVGDELVNRGCRVQLLISAKEVDQQAVKSALGMETVILPAVGLVRGKLLAFALGFWNSYHAAKKAFRNNPPLAVLAMGGFTSAPPVLAGRKFGAVTFFHESNTIPGKANRWLAHVVDQAFVGFPMAANRLLLQNVVTTGTPVRPQFQLTDATACRMALGLQPNRPVLLIMGGSQGASGVNQLVMQALGKLVQDAPELQFLHLTGANDVETARAAYQTQNCKAVVLPFLTEMELALGAATIAISRAGASSLAEIAAMRVPSILIPYPIAADNHQYFNARSFVDSGAALLLHQQGATGEQLAQMVLNLLDDSATCQKMQAALTRWHAPDAAERIAEKMLWMIQVRGKWPAGMPAPSSTQPNQFLENSFAAAV
jgi:UDP-N-acetylglucosamine--N-acetylmuramyl-(pentapeptide) pyrophosphoryl-undecaprenol N-acetylglucosamine transferase